MASDLARAKATAIMLETLDPANRQPGAPDDPARRAAEPAVVGASPAAGCPDLQPASGYGRACDTQADAEGEERPHDGQCSHSAPAGTKVVTALAMWAQAADRTT